MEISDGKTQRDYILQAVQSRSDIDYKALSEAIGKNPTYVQQFITKGSPRALREADMRTLITFIDGDAAKENVMTKDVSGKNDMSKDMLHVPLFEFKAGMGGGGVILTETPDSFMPISQAYIMDMRLGTADLIAIECEGDSMSPTLMSGDQIMINRKDKNPARGGIFTIFDSETLVVKRIEKIPNSDPVMLRLISDNPHHNSYDVIADDTNIIGRVVWFARRI